MYLFTARCMQSWNAVSFLNFCIGYSLWGEKNDFGSGWVRQSRVQAGFGIQFKARADL